MTSPYQRVADLLASARAAVAFTGAGISTESGLPDFRSPGGVWATSRTVEFSEFLQSARGRQEYWRQKAAMHVEFRDARPNSGHRTLADWEGAGRIVGVITQNIDGLHQQAGSRRVWELHGTARQVACLTCGARFDTDPYVSVFLEVGTPPDCPECGGYLKHATVSFGQALPSDVLAEARAVSQSSDLFLALGSSLVVEPAASLPVLAKRGGARLVIVNRDPTRLDELADVVLSGEIGPTLAAIDRALTRP
jgi:NAD-dependent deacetylase